MSTAKSPRTSPAEPRPSGTGRTPTTGPPVPTTSEPTPSGAVPDHERYVRGETEALVAAATAAVLAAGVGLIVFRGSATPLWGESSIGLVALAVTLVVAAVAGGVGYLRSWSLPGRQWRRSLRPWLKALDVLGVVLVHTALGGLLTLGAFALLQQSFRGLALDPFLASGAVALAAGLVAYWVYLSVQSTSTVRLASLLVAFLAIGTFTSMATAQDPRWWEYHFSQLGSFGDGSSGLFNMTLAIAGLLVTSFALSLHRNLQALHRAGVLVYDFAPRVVAAAFVVMGLMLSCVGIVSIPVNESLHNVFAWGLVLAFGVLLLGSPILLRGLPGQFFGVTAVMVAVLIGAAVAFFLGRIVFTAFELTAFVVIFAWIMVFIRIVDASARPGQDAPGAVTDQGPTSASERGRSEA
ncbi:hypothetical protein EXU48_13625 [Occultella glacieicola]|uniref:DUF998 domain-containing protein n=1 Tax=Occultella glacieicola TaxID=2518684 RepID=A0ABY2E1T4_9MICO|nr:hypothetical protein [Occultella glacieicola]TDE92580.1 hypothetical protein EXU48_13625 [Occultella glacieicola]